MTSSVGAIGSMQFIPSTWVGYKYESSGGLVGEDVDITDLETIKREMVMVWMQIMTAKQTLIALQMGSCSC